MKEEIIELQPELIKSSKETEDLKVLVEADAEKAKAKQELVAVDEAQANQAAEVGTPLHLSSSLVLCACQNIHVSDYRSTP